MAASGALAEFAKQKPLVKVGAFFAVALIAGVLYYQLVLAGIRSDIAAAESAHAALVTESTTVKKDEKEYKDLKAKQVDLGKTIAANQTALPTAAQLPAFFDMLNRKVGESSVEVRRWEYQKEIPVEDFFKVPIEIELVGTFQEIKKFFHLLYKMSQKEGALDTAPAPTGPAPASGTGSDDKDRILTIENLRIADPVVKNNELVLTATFRASTFRKDAKIPVVDEKAKKKAAADAKKKAKSQGGKVKEKVEDAMDESDTRARDAAGSDSDLGPRTDKPEGGVDRVKKGM